VELLLKEVVIRIEETSTYERDIKGQRYELEYLEDTDVVLRIRDVPWSNVPAVLGTLLSGRLQLP